VISKKLVLVISDKGGTGKSTWARAYADWLRRKHDAAFIADADGAVGQRHCCMEAAKADAGGLVFLITQRGQRPRWSMRFRTRTATAISDCCRSSVWKRRPSPITFHRAKLSSSCQPMDLFTSFAICAATS
jgi:hypothetical protein